LLKALAKALFLAESFGISSDFAKSFGKAQFLAESFGKSSFKAYNFIELHYNSSSFFLISFESFISSPRQSPTNPKLFLPNTPLALQLQ
jgi:hypothetical protein